MENLADFRTAAVIVGGLLALVVAGIVMARMLRSRAPPPKRAEPAAGASEVAYLDSSHIISGSPAAAAEAAYLDSSHIIAGSTPGAAERTVQGDGGIPAQGDAKAKPGGADPGPRQ